jgi:hypothetical protein
MTRLQLMQLAVWASSLTVALFNTYCDCQHHLMWEYSPFIVTLYNTYCGTVHHLHGTVQHLFATYCSTVWHSFATYCGTVRH